MRISPYSPSFTSNIKNLDMKEINAAYKKLDKICKTPEYKKKLEEISSYNKLLEKELNEKLYNIPQNYLFTTTNIEKVREYIDISAPNK